MALVNGGFLHYMDMKKFIKNLLRNCLSDFETISQECSLGDPFQILFAKFWSVHKHGSGEWGLFALYRHEEILKKSSSQKLLVRFWNNCTGVRVWHKRTSLLTDSGHNCYGQAAHRASKIFGQFSSIWVCISDTGLISNWLLNCLKSSFKKKKWSIKKHGFYGRLIFL